MHLKHCLAVLFTFVFGIAAAAPESPVLPPGSAWQTRTGPQLANEWWQWASAERSDNNPVSDVTGELCAVGQRGSVWFLAGGFGSSTIRRSCLVPVGKALYFPLVNVVYRPAPDDDGQTCEQAKASAAMTNASAIDLFAEIDGKPVPDVKRFRIASKDCFDLYARMPTRMRPYRGFPSATDGFWLLLQPLSPGRHVLKFGGKYGGESPYAGQMIQDIQYQLTVQ